MCFLGWETITCYKPQCGSTFALPATAIARLKQTKEVFHCPNGHQQAFTGTPNVPAAEVRILREQVEVCRTRNVEAERRASLAERRLKAAKDGHAFFEGGRWHGLCPQDYAEQPRGAKDKRAAQRWARRHCHKKAPVLDLGGQNVPAEPPGRDPGSTPAPSGGG